MGVAGVGGAMKQQLLRNGTWTNPSFQFACANNGARVHPPPRSRLWSRGTENLWKATGSPLTRTRRVCACVHGARTLAYCKHRSRFVAAPTRRDHVGLRCLLAGHTHTAV